MEEQTCSDRIRTHNPGMTETYALNRLKCDTKRIDYQKLVFHEFCPDFSGRNDISGLYRPKKYAPLLPNYFRFKLCTHAFDYGTADLNAVS
jgi:hypothetical protein